MGIQIGTLTITWYGLFAVAGILAAAAAGYVLMRIKGLCFDDFIQTACFAGLGAMLGAKVLYLAVSWENIDFSRLTDPAYLNALLGGGFVFYGGVAGGFLGLFLCGKILHIPVMEYARAAVPSIPLAHALGRVGCAFAGCCYGIPYSGPGAVVYTDSPFAPEGISLFPVQGAEAAAELVISAVLFFYVLREKGKEKTRSLELYLLLYAAVRFILEFFRYDDAQRGMLGGLSISQWISIFVFAAAAVLWKQPGKKQKNCTPK